MPYSDKAKKKQYDALRWQDRREEEVKKKRGRYRNLTVEQRERELLLRRENHLKRKFGIALEQWEKMAAAQGGGCAICKGPPSGVGRFHVDHDHSTGRVRGLLCSQCNHLLGQARDSIKILFAAISYLKSGTISTSS